MRRIYTVTIVIGLPLIALVTIFGPLAAESVQAAPPVRPLQAPCQVTTTANSGAGSLRECIQNAGNGDTITFNPTDFPPGSPATIALVSGLPNIITDNLTIDGTGAGVILNGNGTPGGTNGLVIDGASNVVIKGLQILNFPQYGIEVRNGANNNIIGGMNSSLNDSCSGDCNLISGNSFDGVHITNANYNTVSGNYIGTNISSTLAISNGHGIYLGSGAQNNTIGGDNDTPGGNCTGECNLISGNRWEGVLIQNGAMTNTVIGNYVGPTVSGTAAIRNGQQGIAIRGAGYNIIGGNTPGQRNLISGNDNDEGVLISLPGSTHNKVTGNYIGTNVSGTGSLGNRNGVYIELGASYNVVGGVNATPSGSCTGECNLISGNGSDGVHIQDSGTMSNTVSGNYIGTDISGTADLGNADFGVTIEQGAQSNFIGGDTPGERNLISGSNSELGVSIRGTGTMNNTVTGNYIGTNANGTVSIGNALGGVLIGNGAQYNAIGGNTPAERNLISGNDKTGVLIEDMDTAYNTVSGNYIGTDVNGTGDLGNGTDGVLVHFGATNNLIGGDTPAERNLIGGNDANGVHIKGVGLMSDAPLLDDVSLTVNGGANQLLNGDFSNNLLHWSTDDDNPSATRSINNVTYHSTPAGYQFNRNGGLDKLRTWYDTLTQTVVLADPWNPASSNWISVSPGTQVQLSFWYSGTLAEVELWGQKSGGGDAELIKEVLPVTTTWTPVVLNTTLPGDIVSVGLKFEVESNPPTTHNTVSGNYIGTNVNGTGALRNNGHGVYIANGARKNLIGGDTSGEGNIISGNGEDGVAIDDATTIHNTISGNYIGTDASGMAPLGNGVGVAIAATSYITVGGTTAGERNVISANSEEGIIIDAGAMHNTVSGNYIGTKADGTGSLGNGQAGIALYDGAQFNLIGGDSAGNLISNNGAFEPYGVRIDGSSTLYNTLQQNSIYNNAGKGIALVNGGNTELPAPVITEVNTNTNTITGTALANSTVEIFSDDDNEGRYFHGVATAGTSGIFTYTHTGTFTGTNLTATATDAGGNTSEFGGQISDIYLPIIVKNYDPSSIPSAPVLNTISNSDGDGNYTVSWSAVSGVIGYTVQEDDNPIFSSPTARYAGSGTSTSIAGQAAGTYYYRVRSSKSGLVSSWSNIQSVTVSPPPGPEPGHYTGTAPSVSFDVTGVQQICNYDITVPFGAGSCHIQPSGCATIINSTFTFTQAELGAIYTIDGTFDTETHASGSYSVSMCESSLIFPPSTGVWDANK